MSGVALVFPYFRTRTRTEVLFPPLGPALLSAHLKRAGVEARVFDGTFSSFDELVEDVVAWRPAIVGISAMASLTGNAVRSPKRSASACPAPCWWRAARCLPSFRAAFCRTSTPCSAVRPTSASPPSAATTSTGGSRRRLSATCRWWAIPAWSWIAAASASTMRPCITLPSRSPAFRCPTAAASTTAPTSGSGRLPGTGRPPSRYTRLSLRVRVLLQAGLRPRGALSSAGRRVRRDRRHRPPRLRRSLDRRRHVHAAP